MWLFNVVSGYNWHGLSIFLYHYCLIHSHLDDISVKELRKSAKQSLLLLNCFGTLSPLSAEFQQMCDELSESLAAYCDIQLRHYSQLFAL